MIMLGNTVLKLLEILSLSLYVLVQQNGVAEGRAIPPRKDQDSNILEGRDLVNEQALTGEGVQFVNTKFSNLFHQPATPLKVGQGLHAALECVAQNGICQQRNQFANGVLQFILQRAGLNGNYQFEAELPLPGGYADLVMRPANGGRDRIVVEYKLLQSANPGYINNRVLPNAERQVRHYAQQLRTRGFNVVRMYVVVINEVQNGSVLALYRAA